MTKHFNIYWNKNQWYVAFKIFKEKQRTSNWVSDSIFSPELHVGSLIQDIKFRVSMDIPQKTKAFEEKCENIC